MASEVIRNVVINLAIKQQEARIKVPTSVVEEAKKPIEAISKAVDDTQKKIEGAGFKIGDSLKQSGEGAFTAARGFAFLFTSTDEGYKQLISNITLAQGAFDLTKGSFETIKGVSAALQVAAASGGLYAVAMKGVAVAQTAVAVTAAVAGTAVKALWGPLGIALAGITALVGIGAGLWASYSREEKAAADAAKPLISNLDILRGILKDLSQLDNDLQFDKEALALKESVTAAERLALIDENRFRIQAATVQLQRLPGAKKGAAALDLQLLPGTEEEQNAVFAIVQKIQDLQKTGIEQEKERLGIYREQQAALQANLDKQKAASEAAKAAAESERDRVRGIQEGLGRLDLIQRAELEKLGKKVQQGGQLSEEEAKRVGELGGGIGRDFESRFFAQRGAGLENLLAPFNNGVNLTGQGSKLEELTRKQAEEAAKFAETTNKVMAEIQQLRLKEKQGVTELLEEMKEYFAKKSDFETLKEGLENARRQQQEQAIGQKGVR